MTTPRYQEDFYREYPKFAGRLLEDASGSLHGDGATPSPELAGLWTAAGAVLGMQTLLAILKHSDELQGMMRQFLSALLQSTPFQQTSPTWALGLGTLLHQFEAKLQGDTPHQILRQQYIDYLERLERNFQALAQECREKTISPQEYYKEIEALYLQSLYILTRLQRMSGESQTIPHAYE